MLDAGTGVRNLLFTLVISPVRPRRLLVLDAIDAGRVPRLGTHAAYTKMEIRDKLIEHRRYITLHGEDMPEVREWAWPY